MYENIIVLPPFSLPLRKRISEKERKDSNKKKVFFDPAKNVLIYT